MKSFILTISMFILGQTALAVEPLNAETMTVNGCTQQATDAVISTFLANSFTSSDQNDTYTIMTNADRQKVDYAFEYSTDFFPTAGDTLGPIEITGLQINKKMKVVQWTMSYRDTSYNVHQEYDAQTNTCKVTHSGNASVYPLDGIH